MTLLCLSRDMVKTVIAELCRDVGWNGMEDCYKNPLMTSYLHIACYKMALVIKNDDPDYIIPGKRVYLSRMIVKPDYRNKGIGDIMLEFLIGKAKEMGVNEISLGIDCDNENAVYLYNKFGFTEVIFESEDEHGKYMKLLKRI